MNKFLFLLVFMFFVSGCSGSSVANPTLATNSSNNKIPLSYDLLKAAKVVRPNWIDQPPPNKAGIHYLVGLSGYHADERNAREDAMRHAREQFARYTGVEVSILDEMIESVYGKGSGILDSDLKIENKATHNTDALVSRIKAEEWYWEKLGAKQGQVYRGDVYKYWVKVSVPEDEYERVQKWKKDQALKDNNNRKKQHQWVRQTVDASLIKHRSVLTNIDQLLQTGNLHSALAEVQIENQRLLNQIESFQESSAPLAGYSLIKDARNQLLSKMDSIGSIYKIDVGKIGSICSISGEQKVEIPVWLWACTNNKCLPSDGVPLVIQSKDDEILGKVITNNRGEASFIILNPLAATYTVKIDASSNSLSGLDHDILARVERLENRIVIKKVERNLSEITKTAVQNLFTFPAYFPIPVQKIVVGPVTYKDTSIGGDFALLIRNKITEQVVKIPEISVVSPARRSVNVIAKVMRTRGITAVGKDSLGSVATHAVVDGADAFIETTYSILTDHVSVKMQLKNTRENTLLSTSTASIPLISVPAGINPLPPLNQNPGLLSSSSPGAITLQISSHLGDGQTYVEGEKISYFVNIDKSAFILLIYEDAESNLIQILPNKYSQNNYYQAGSFLEIPDDQDNFEFIVAAPFGVERVWAFASSEKFPELTGVVSSNGLKLLNKPIIEVLRKLRQHGHSPFVSYGESQTVITTISKPK